MTWLLLALLTLAWLWFARRWNLDLHLVIAWHKAWAHYHRWQLQRGMAQLEPRVRFQAELAMQGRDLHKLRKLLIEAGGMPARKPYEAPAVMQSYAMTDEPAMHAFTRAMLASSPKETLCRCGHRRIEHSDSKRAVCRMPGCSCVSFDVVIG